jgi:hypothetical protein
MPPGLGTMAAFSNLRGGCRRFCCGGQPSSCGAATRPRRRPRLTGQTCHPSLVDYTAQLFRKGKAAMSADLAGILDRLVSKAVSW